MNKFNPTKSETQSVRGNGFQEITNDRNDTPNQKVQATTIAQLALAGHTVHKIEAGFLVCRWGQTRVCHNLAELVGFARIVGAAQ